jgi:16S rRNA (guanine966-N2)-methyltransferase
MRKTGDKNTGGEVRISGGVFRGQRIKTPGGGTHPMGERERTALFNMIFEHLNGSSVIDLYCGGGTLGIEALSRGAAFVLFVDNSARAIKTTNENLQKLGICSSQSKTVVLDATNLTDIMTDCFDLVIADPPYDRYDEKMLANLPKLLLKNGILVLSHPGEAPEVAGLKLQKTHSYARANISVYYKAS